MPYRTVIEEVANAVDDKIVSIETKMDKLTRSLDGLELNHENDIHECQKDIFTIIQPNISDELSHAG